MNKPAGLFRSPCTWLGIVTALIASTACAADFNVRNFGAKADGVTDDSPAFVQCVEAACKSTEPHPVILIPAGRYSLRQKMGQGMIELKHADGITVQGEKGTEIISSLPSVHMVNLENCQGVTVRGLTLDRHPLVFTQGKIEAINLAAKTVDVTIEDGYDEPDAPLLSPLKTLLVWTDPGAATYDHSRYPSTITQRDRLAPGKWRFKLNNDPLQEYIGKRFLLWDNVYKGWGFNINHCRDTLIEDVRYYAGGADGGFGVWSCPGDTTLRHCTVDVPPGSTRLISAAGGSQEFNNRGTLTIEDCSFAKIDDDCVNIGANFAQILAQKDPRTLIIQDKNKPYEVGDTLAIWDWFKKNERSEAKLVSITRVNPGNVELGLDRDTKVIHPAGSSGLPSRSDWDGRGKFEENDGIDRVSDAAQAGKLIVRHSRFQNLRARCILVKTSNSVIEDNTFYDTHMCAIVVGPEFYWGEGPAVSNLIIRNNKFLNVDGSSILIECHHSDESYDNRQIIIEGNTFQDYGRKGGKGIVGIQGVPILVRNADGVSIRENKFIPPPEKTGPRENPIKVEVSRNVDIVNNPGATQQQQP